MTTEYSPTTIWVIFVAAGVGTYALRLSFVALLGRVEEVPPRVVGVLRFVPSAVLAALAGSAVVSVTIDPTVGVDADRAEVVAAVIAGLVAWRTESVLATIGVGMAALWSVQWLL